MAKRWVCLQDQEIEALCEVVDAEGNYCLLHPQVIEAAHKTISKLQKSRKRIKIASAKGKGRALQQKICRDIAELTGIAYNQQDDESLLRSREMGQAGLDVIIRGEARQRFPFSVECKSSESFNINKTIEQVKANQIEGTNWLIIYKKKMWPSPVVALEWDVFLKIYNNIKL